jgi:hypothetical protein
VEKYRSDMVCCYCSYFDLYHELIDFDIVEQVFDLLKECNALLAPFKEALQALLLLGNLLQNNGNPQAAWVLGGTTLRMAICLGIHVRDDLVRHGAIHVDTESATCLR